MSRRTPLFLLVLGVAGLATLVWPDDEEKSPSRDEAPKKPAGPGGCFPARVAFGDTKLLRNGHALLEWGLFNVDLYWGGLYLERPEDDAKKLLEGDGSYFLRLRWVRDLDKDKINKAWNAAVKKSAGKRFDKFEKRLGRLKGMMRAVKDGENMDFRYANGKFEVFIGGMRRGAIQGADWGRLFLRLYIGDHPPSPELKKGLLGGYTR